MAIFAVTVAFGGYGNLPDVFDSTTGYVTLNSSDGTGAGNQSFFLAKNWSDGNPPHSDTNYYVQAAMRGRAYPTRGAPLCSTPFLTNEADQEVCVDVLRYVHEHGPGLKRAPLYVPAPPAGRTRHVSWRVQVEGER